MDFWDNLVNEINRYAMVINSCYSSFREEFKANDELNHLACLQIAFNRPAFTEDFGMERNCKDFEEALVTTKRLFRTGFTFDRWLKVPVVQTIPVEFLPDGKYRAFVKKLEAEVEKVYGAYMKDKAKILKVASFGGEQAIKYNAIRRAVMDLLNGKLSELGRAPIPLSYS